MSYEILEHTADEKFRAEGDSLGEAFSEATKAFSEVVKGGEGEGKHSIAVESENYEALLFDFLDRLIFLQDSEGVAVSHAKDLEIHEKENGYQLEAEIMVDLITSGMNYTDIKAPTYNEMKVDFQDGKWILEAVLDI
ncbi:archease [Candidatus Nanohalobium constans]|uniref:Archease n=1 Tax=Candidatus Nanohalobium constans TaxID=2565781 RepID=A0A5Q0UHD0_9ARCH|nr:archease [Candidatus Nanohalobium constans]QGA80994.1 archease [Candidatus Nanohalobium constans]